MWTDPVWETVFKWATGIAAVSGGIGICAAFVSALVGYEITGAAQREADQKIISAQVETAKANERAANAELDLARLRGELAPRSLNGENFLRILAQGATGALQIVYAEEHLESRLFALSLQVLSEKAGWAVPPTKAIPGNAILTRWPGFGPSVYVEVRSMTQADGLDAMAFGGGDPPVGSKSLYGVMSAAIMRASVGGANRGSALGGSDPSLPEGTVRVTIIPR